MTSALETMGLGKQYGDQWALRDCTLSVPSGRVAALVGPNGAGKSTLLQLASGLNFPSAGAVHVFGLSPQHDPGLVLPRIGFLSQDRPLYRGFTVAEMLTVGKKMNRAHHRHHLGNVPGRAFRHRIVDPAALHTTDPGDMVLGPRPLRHSGLGGR